MSVFVVSRARGPRLHLKLIFLRLYSECSIIIVLMANRQKALTRHQQPLPKTTIIL